MFNQITGSYTVYDSEGITDSTLSLIENSLKDWVITIEGEEYRITGNTTTKLLFTNTLAAGGTYTVDYITRELLKDFESELCDTNKFPETMIQDKIRNTSRHFENKVESHLNNLYFNYSDSTDPLDLISNIYKVQLPFIYYCLSEVYSDTMYVRDDINDYKVNKYLNKYNELIKTSLSYLRIDENEDGEISNDEKGTEAGGTNYLLR